MAGRLNPHAPVYIPSSLISQYENHPSNYVQVQPSSGLLFDQAAPFQIPVYSSAPPPVSPYPELCYYPPPHHVPVYSTCRSISWKEFAYGGVPLLSPMPIPFPVPKAVQERATLTLQVEGDKKVAFEMPQEDDLVPETKVNQEVEEGGCRAGGAAKAQKGFKRFRGGGNSIVWRRKDLVPKSTGRRRVLQPLKFQFRKEDGKTTVMIKNLPNKFSKEKLLGILDQHCYEENEKLKNEGNGEPSELGEGEVSSATLSEFDFLYLPIDFTTGSNMGYAFVNFTSAVAAWRLYNSLHHYDWKPHGSRKICEVTYARIQGSPALHRHFKNSTFVCESDEFLPVRFMPPRSGYGQPEQQFVGRRIPAAHNLQP